MNRKEATALVKEMAREEYHAETRQIGNGEWCAIINSTFLWSNSDWRAYKKGTLPALVEEKELVS